MNAPLAKSPNFCLMATAILCKSFYSLTQFCFRFGVISSLPTFWWHGGNLITKWGSASHYGSGYARQGSGFINQVTGSQWTLLHLYFHQNKFILSQLVYVSLCTSTNALSDYWDGCVSLALIQAKQARWATLTSEQNFFLVCLLLPYIWLIMTMYISWTTDHPMLLTPGFSCNLGW